MKEEPGIVVRVATPRCSVTQRLALLLLLGAAIGLLIWGRTDPRIFEQTRMALIVRRRRFSMCYRARWQPCRSWCKRFGNWRACGRPILSLKWRTRDCCNGSIRRALLVENDRLRTLLNFVGDDTVRSVTGRIIGNSNGPFIRSLLINAGMRDGVRRGHVAVSGAGLLGRDCVDRREVRAGTSY